MRSARRKDRLSRNDHVRAEAAGQANILVTHRKRNLPPIRQLRLIQLPAETGFIDRFQKPRPEPAMHRDREPNDLPRQRAIPARATFFPAISGPLRPLR